MATIICTVRADRNLFRNYIDSVHMNTLDYVTELVDPATNQRVARKMQIGVRPIQLFEFTFPKQQTEKALQIINPGLCWTPQYNKYFNITRKIMGLQKIPEFKPNPKPYHRFVEVTGIGYKDDKFTELGAEMI